MTTDTETRLPTPAEVGVAIKMMRDILGWSQETLAELCGLTVRTIQRVEASQPASIDTRRAIARGFGFEDLDFFQQPLISSSPEKLLEQKDAFDREHLVLDAEVVDGRGVIRRLLDADGYHAIGPGSTVALPPAAEDAYAAVLDFLRDCMDVANEAGRAEMLGYGDTIEELAEPLRTSGFCLLAAVREVRFTSGGGQGASPMLTTIIYVVVAPTKGAPKHIVVARKVGGHL
jgi:transcriptional regulator with XRE-family HTH domain